MARQTRRAALVKSYNLLKLLIKDCSAEKADDSGRDLELAGATVLEDGDFKGTLEDVILHSTNEFYRWHTDLEAARISETEEKYQHYAQTLKGHHASCQELLGKARAMLCLPVACQVPFAMHTICRRDLGQAVQSASCPSHWP